MFEDVHHDLETLARFSVVISTCLNECSEEELCRRLLGKSFIHKPRCGFTHKLENWIRMNSSLVILTNLDLVLSLLHAFELEEEWFAVISVLTMALA